MTTTKKYRVFCARCGDTFPATEFPDALRRIIDKPCRRCAELGVDAVEVERVTA